MVDRCIRPIDKKSQTSASVQAHAKSGIFYLHFGLKTKRDTVPTALEVCKNSALRAPPEARTLDTLIKSQVLYQLS